MVPRELAAIADSKSTIIARARARFCAQTRLYKTVFAALLILLGCYFVLYPRGMFLDNVVSEEYLRDHGWKQSYEQEQQDAAVRAEISRIQEALDRAGDDDTVDRRLLSSSMKLLGSMVIGVGPMYALDTAADMLRHGKGGHVEPADAKLTDEEGEHERQHVEMLHAELDRQEAARERLLRRLSQPSSAVLLPIVSLGMLIAGIGAWSLCDLRDTSYQSAVSYSMLAMSLCASQVLSLTMGLAMRPTDEAEGVTISQGFVHWMLGLSGACGLFWFMHFFRAKSLTEFASETCKEEGGGDEDV